MIGNSWNIDAIVSEVLRRLDEPQHAAGQPGPDGSAPRAREDDPATLQIRQRVVTLIGLGDRLSGVRRVLLPPGAVVTPAVRDEFRRRGIQVHTAPTERAPNLAPASRLLLVVTQPPPPQRLLDAVTAAAAPGQTLGPAPLTELIRPLAESLRDLTRAAVLITRQPAATLCLANRYPGLRAVSGTGNALTVRQAVQAIGANVLVLDCQQPVDAELARMLRHFRQARPSCPPAWKTLLENPP